mgnify:CR=1 FL=1
MNLTKALIIHVDRMKNGPVEAFSVDIEWGWSKAIYAREIILARREGSATGPGRKVQRVDERELAILSCTTRTELYELKSAIDGWPEWLRKLAGQRWGQLS